MTLSTLCDLKCLRIIYPRHNALIRELFGDGLPSSYDLDRNKTLLIYSSDGIFGYPKPLTPNIVQVGPLHIMPPKALPEVSIRITHAHS